MKPADNAFAREAIEAKGWWGAHRWLVLRRLTDVLRSMAAEAERVMERIASVKR